MAKQQKHPVAAVKAAAIHTPAKAPKKTAAHAPVKVAAKKHPTVDFTEVGRAIEAAGRFGPFLNRSDFLVEVTLDETCVPPKPNTFGEVMVAVLKDCGFTHGTRAAAMALLFDAERIGLFAGFSSSALHSIDPAVALGHFRPYIGPADKSLGAYGVLKVRRTGN